MSSFEKPYSKSGVKRKIRIKHTVLYVNFVYGPEKINLQIYQSIFDGQGEKHMNNQSYDEAFQRNTSENGKTKM